MPFRDPYGNKTKRFNRVQLYRLPKLVGLSITPRPGDAIRQSDKTHTMVKRLREVQSMRIQLANQTRGYSEG